MYETLTLALNVARVLETDPQVNFEIVPSELKETFAIVGELAWWATTQVFLSEIPG